MYWHFSRYLVTSVIRINKNYGVHVLVERGGVQTINSIF